VGHDCGFECCFLFEAVTWVLSEAAAKLAVELYFRPPQLCARDNSVCMVGVGFHSIVNCVLYV
jgi:hypothetical protein